MNSINSQLRQTLQENLFDEIAGLELKRAEINGELLILKETLRCYGHKPIATESQNAFRHWFYDVKSVQEINTNTMANQLINVWGLHDEH